jgi:hypothetical protein
MMAGETVFTGAPHPGTELEVLYSSAYYLGFRDEFGMPYSRESIYFGSREAAEEALRIVNQTFPEEISFLSFMRDTEFRG